MARTTKSKTKKPAFCVDSTISYTDIAKAGSAVNFAINALNYENGKPKPAILGRLAIGQGTLNWYPRGKSKNYISIKWSDLEKVLKKGTGQEE
ncbi:hypothetical protein [Aestuariivirga litoralis]|uniref:hypothetical protein n=1 Tax=Aestuariivirga litoralis TaxID=2650924 RepID=UPI0011B84C38|nr:hypothetical protein [Aestuariivirga litoralis]